MDTNHSPIISPLTMRESARGITLTSIYDEMLARRELSVMGNIETPMVHDLCQQIRLLDATDPSRPITIFVASAGGSVRSGLAIYDAMRLASCPIRTVVRPIGSPTAACPCPCALCSMTSQICRSPRSTTCSRLSEAATSGQRCCCSQPTSSMRSMARHAHAPSWATATRIWCWRSRIPRVPGCFPTALTRYPARSWRRRLIARGSLYAVALPNRSSALGSKTIRSTGSCPRRSEAMRRPRSRRRVLAARGAPAMFHKGRAPRDHGKAKGPHPIGYGPLTIRRDALTAATTCDARDRTR